MLDAIQSEYSVIGAICANPVEARRLNLTADDFTSDAAARVFSEAVANKDFDAVVAMNVLSTALGAEQARKFITGCMDLCPTSAMLQARAKEVRDAALNRRLRDDATAALEELDGVELADRLAAISRQHLQREQGNAVSLTKALTDYMQGLERENADRLNTGFYRLDGILKGMRPGQLIVLGARPAVGKSAFLLNVALQVARVGKVVLFTMEMSSKELVQRAIAASSNATLDDLLDGEVDEQIIKKIVDPIGSLSSLPIIIDDRPGLTVQQVSARARLHPDARLASCSC